MQSTSPTPTVTLSATSARTTQWGFPLAKDQVTFIDHGCIIDKEGYPLYPNNNTTYVLPPGTIITNFGTVGFSKTSSSKTSKDRRWKIYRAHCLGVMVCDSEGCEYARPTPTGPGKIEELIRTTPCCPADGCAGKIYWMECRHTQTRFDHELSTGWRLMRHQGFHDHPWPTSKKADPLTKKLLALEVAKNPKAGALQLKVGNPDKSHEPDNGVASIHGSFANSDRLRHHRQEILRGLNLAPDKDGDGAGDRFMNDMFMWDELSCPLFFPISSHLCVVWK
ncbi:uncharacterized protein PGTG_04351 [Puccinia graminis f. sp. tritici CRL 75-36-700-3]|uniref:GCM domain-containing protein n=1 Tax=Puccinia graminis f. sp. tritici (strain CRL 75-36-700-3 / race SCCL) TaxID=418459 RepID=E3K226_PUCGT|nr:uncharacterized protein PGTG_04351 [Puccinia graminis f. sp. tritici CRL 75-36-700-3]EFP78395.1 hypothetical protein PGTG_04351 [Puccinia graminis f. sp. tritici CRL 75-36-700-3]